MTRNACRLVISSAMRGTLELDKLLRQIKHLDEGFGMQPLPFTE